MLTNQSAGGFNPFNMCILTLTDLILFFFHIMFNLLLFFNSGNSIKLSVVPHAVLRLTSCTRALPGSLAKLQPTSQTPYRFTFIRISPLSVYKLRRSSSSLVLLKSECASLLPSLLLLLLLLVNISSNDPR